MYRYWHLSAAPTRLYEAKEVVEQADGQGACAAAIDTSDHN